MDSPKSNSVPKQPTVSRVEDRHPSLKANDIAYYVDDKTGEVVHIDHFFNPRLG